MQPPEPSLSVSATAPVRVVRVPLPTPFGQFDVTAFESASGFVHLALVLGEVGAGGPVLTRVHSECLTGDALGSLRCDCGVQLRASLRAIAAEGRGVLVYATGHEGRGIGLVNKLRAYVEQDAGADTVDANVRLGFAVDRRDYGDAAAVLRALGVSQVRLLSNNPAKAVALRAAGVEVCSTEPLGTAAHIRNLSYLRTKELRLGHHRPTGPALAEVADSGAVDVTALLGAVIPPPERPWVVLKYAQTLDGRIATGTGDSRWISGEAERRIAHAMRAACDGVMVGIGTVLRDDPQLTVRMVEGASPARVVLDATLRTPPAAKILSAEAPTVIYTSAGAPLARRGALEAAGARLRTVPGSEGGVDLAAALGDMASLGVRTLLVEGGSQVITSLLRARLADRIVVSISPKIFGAGTEAVGDLAVERAAEGLTLSNRSVHIVGDDVLLAWDLPKET